MHLEELAQRIIEQIDAEGRLLRRAGLFVLPLLLLPLMALVAQVLRGGWPLLVGALGASALIVQCGLLTEPLLERVRRSAADAAPYLPPPPALRGVSWSAPLEALLLLPMLAVALASLVLFVPAMLGRTSVWQQLVAAALGLALALYLCWRLAQGTHMLRRARAHYLALLAAQRARSPAAPRGQPADGLLHPGLLARLDAAPMPAARLSAAARALVRLEGYLLLRDAPETSAGVLHAALSAWGEQAHADEQRHWLLPPIGGKLYLPCSARGLVAGALGATARRLGLDGAFSGTLGTWLLRLPPARSYAVQARLLDALAALGVLPRRAVLIHHLTVAGDLAIQAAVPLLLHLLAAPLVLEERPGPARGDDRPFVMSGGGIIDDLDRGVRATGRRTDFVDGFLLLDLPELQEVEHLAAHAINLRVKQLTAWGATCHARPDERRSSAERRAAARYTRLRADLAAFLARYDLGDALLIPWVDGSWAEQWPVVRAIGQAKQRDPAFLPAAQSLRDDALDDLERIAAKGA
jgi:hypothetical protein